MLRIAIHIRGLLGLIPNIRFFFFNLSLFCCLYLFRGDNEQALLLLLLFSSFRFTIILFVDIIHNQNNSYASFHAVENAIRHSYMYVCIFVV